jgi:ParB-like chromosome segregation protein Spo0J
MDAILVDKDATPRRRLRNLDELATSIRVYGLLQPMVVREARAERGKYQLVAGHLGGSRP